MLRSLTIGRVAGPNPWRALTLEWTTSSPPPAHNFIGDPVPFKNPYGYGTEAGYLYLEAIESRIGPSAPLSPTVTPPAPAPAPSGD
jgi:heme/copper-type cytochrome/quinol oxidase subunit 1